MRKHLLLPLALGALLLAGCSAVSKDSAEQSDSGAGYARTQPLPPAAAEEKREAEASTSDPQDSRSLIHRGDITVKVDDVQKSADALASLVATAGGFVASEKRIVDSRQAHAVVTVRVPSKDYPATLEKIAGLGREQSRGSNVEDVTEAVVDLDTRIAAQKASVESVRRMFERASTLQDVVLLEKELSQRQTELASLEAKKRRLDDLVALSTITVTLAGPNTEIEEDPDPSFFGGLKAGWKAFVVSAQVGSAVLGYILPFIGAIAIPIIVLIVVLRLRRRPAQ